MFTARFLTRGVVPQNPSEAQLSTPSGFRERSNQRVKFFLAVHGTYVQHGQPSRRSGGGVGECKKSSVKMKTSVKIKNLDGDPKRYPVYRSRHGTVNLARIGQRLAHVGPLERLRSIQRLGKLSPQKTDIF